jgi:hypothetical protein
MLRNVMGGVVVATVVSTLAACALLRPPPKAPPAPAASPTPSPSPSPAPFAWANGAEYAVVVRKEERTLTVYHRTEQVKVYPVVTGIASYGPQVSQRDLPTPAGV